MEITINFDEIQNLGESRSMFLHRKFEEAYEASLVNNCEVYVTGYFYHSDITVVHQIACGLEPIENFPAGGAKYKVRYLISAFASQN